MHYMKLYELYKFFYEPKGAGCLRFIQTRAPSKDYFGTQGVPVVFTSRCLPPAILYGKKEVGAVYPFKDYVLKKGRRGSVPPLDLF